MLHTEAGREEEANLDRGKVDVKNAGRTRHSVNQRERQA
jgi:hypothetical protein